MQYGEEPKKLVDSQNWSSRNVTLIQLSQQATFSHLSHVSWGPSYLGAEASYLLYALLNLLTHTIVSMIKYLSFYSKQIWGGLLCTDR